MRAACQVELILGGASEAGCYSLQLAPHIDVDILNILAGNIEHVDLLDIHITYSNFVSSNIDLGLNRVMVDFDLVGSTIYLAVFIQALNPQHISAVGQSYLSLGTASESGGCSLQLIPAIDVNILQILNIENMVLLNPSQSDCDHYLIMDNIIVVRPLIAEAPLSSYQGINTPSIEKILIDIVSDKEFNYAGGAELYHIYSNALESVNVNLKKLLRYASRRNRKEKIKQYLNSILNPITYDTSGQPHTSLDSGSCREI